MNVSTTYNYPSAFNNPIQQGGSAFSFEKDEQRWLPVPVETSANQRGYNYYVQEDTSETIYTDRRNLQQIHHPTGSLINIFI